MKRIIVLGGLGQFGSTALNELRRLNFPAQAAGRSAAADIQIDANDPASLRAKLRAGDIVLDTAGPFHTRTPALIEAAIDVGFDIIDINDNLRYAEMILAREPQIKTAGIRVLSSASTVSAVAATVIRQSRIVNPIRVRVFLAPASRHTANAGSALALIRSIGGPVRVFHNGCLEERTGWSDPQPFPMPPLKPLIGRLFESADALYLPRIWPSLQYVAMYVDPNTFGVHALLRRAAHSPWLRHLLEKHVQSATMFARWFGSAAGGIGYEIEEAPDRIVRFAILAERNSFYAAIAPAILATRKIALDQFLEHGLILPDRHCDSEELFELLRASNIAFRELA
jgi:hypothetical protein